MHEFRRAATTIAVSVLVLPLVQFSREGMAIAWPVMDDMEVRVVGPAENITSISESPDGHVWFAGNGGLFRFDGVRLDRPLRKEGLLSVRVAANGDVWTARADGRIWRLRGDSVTEHEIAVAHPGTTLMALDPNGTPWFYLGGTLATLIDGVPTVVPAPVGLQGQVVAWQLAADGRMFFATSHGLFVSEAPVHMPAATAAPWNVRERWQGKANCFSLRAEQDGTTREVLLGSPAGVLRISLSGNGVTRVTPDVVTQVAWGPDGSIWTQNNGNFTRHRNGASPTLDVDNGIPSHQINAMVFDREGILWVATSHGVALLRQRPPVTAWTSVNGMSADVVFSVYPARNGAVWMATTNGVSRYQDWKFTNFASGSGFFHTDQRSIAEDKDGNIFVSGLKAGLYRFSNERFETLSIPGGSHGGTRSLYFDRTNRLWLGFFDGRLGRLENQVFTLVRPAPENSKPVSGAPSGISAFGEDSKGNLWTTHEGVGLLRIRGQEQTLFGRRDGLTDPDTLSLFIDDHDAVWVGTRTKGLFRFDGNNWKNFTQDDGLPDAAVHGITGDLQGRLWLSSSRGICWMWRRELNTFLDSDHKGTRPSIVVYGLEDGLHNLEAVHGFMPAAATAPDGRVWFPTLRGAAVIDPARLSPRVHLPRPLITSATLAGKPLTEAGTDADRDSKLTFRFTAPDFLAPHRLRFRVRLLGRETTWHAADSDRLATYGAITPGKYVFQVELRSTDDPTLSAMAERVFVILPPWYRRPWFFAPVAMTLATLALLLHRARLSRMRGTYRTRLAERERIAQDLHDSLEQDLAGLKLHIEAAGLLVGQASPKASEHLSRATELLSASAADVRTAIWGLRNHDVGTRELRDAIFGRLDRTLTGGTIAFDVVTHGVPRLLPEPVATAFLRIASESVANAMKHAEPSTITVTLENQGENGVQLRVENDGGNFKVAMEKPGTNGTSAGFGLAGMKKRAAVLGATLEVRPRPEGGTLVAFRVPAEKLSTTEEKASD